MHYISINSVCSHFKLTVYRLQEQTNIVLTFYIVGLVLTIGTRKPVETRNPVGIGMKRNPRLDEIRPNNALSPVELLYDGT